MDFEDLRRVTFAEPRIGAMKRMLEALLGVVQLESDGAPVNITGFRLRNLSHWECRRPPGFNAGAFLDELAGSCNAACSFCYLKGNPPNWRATSGSAATSYTRFLTRVSRYREREGRMLFPMFSQVHEALSHPRSLEALQEIRSRSSEWMMLTTNGIALTESVVRKLGSLNPVHITVSMNSTRPTTRSQLMGDQNPELALGSLALLREAEIPFAVSCVPWPTIPLEEIENCLRYADESEAERLIVSLPGYTKYNAPQAGSFNTLSHWAIVTARLAPLRYELESPILILPSAFETALDRQPLSRAKVLGVGRNSPAWISGLRVGDAITRVNDEIVISGAHATDLVRKALRNRIVDIPVGVDRAGHSLALALRPCGPNYPYFPTLGPGVLGIYVPLR
ncbi:MAG: radical SAM protein [bacterium]|nr:radical SAM protein [bacterium]